MRVLVEDDLVRKMKPGSNSYKPLLLLSIAFLLSAGFNTSYAIAIDPLESADKTKTAPSKTVFISLKVPPIELQGRDGAKDFSGINEQLERENKEVLIKRVAEYLKQNPKSGLAHEILGTLMFTSGRVGEAAALFKAAIELEPDQKGPKTKLGIILMEWGRLIEAETLFKDALKIDPSDRVASQRLGLLYEYLGKDGLAIKFFRRGLIGTDKDYLGVSVNLGRLLNKQGRFHETVEALEPRLPLTYSALEPHMILGAAYLSTDQFEMARARFQRVLELDEASREAKIGLVIALKGLGRLEEALQKSKALAGEHPKWLVAQLQTGDILLELDRLSEAQRVFDKAIKAGSDKNDIQRRLAQYYVRVKDYAKAKQIYQGLLATDAADISDYTKLSELQRAEKEYDKGIETLKMAVKRFPDNDYLNVRLGSEYATLRQYEKAAPVLKQVVEKSPNNPRVLRDYSLVLAKIGDTKGAVKYARRLKELFPLQPAESLFYAAQLEVDGQLEAAETEYLELLRGDRENVVALNNLANLMAGSERLAEAERYARRANLIVKNNPQLLDTLGWILYQQGQYKQAAEVLGKAAGLAPNMAVIAYHNGMAQFEVGNAAEARSALKRALALDSDADWAGSAKAKLAE